MNQSSDCLSDSAVTENLPICGDRLPPLIEKRFRALIARAAEREPRYDGIPAILIVEDYGVTPKREMTPAEGDAAVGWMYAWAATALAAIIEADGGDPYYPSICPAMSLVADLTFAGLPFDSGTPVAGQPNVEDVPVIGMPHDVSTPATGLTVETTSGQNGESGVPNGTSNL